MDVDAFVTICFLLAANWFVPDLDAGFAAAALAVAFWADLALAVALAEAVAAVRVDFAAAAFAAADLAAEAFLAAAADLPAGALLALAFTLFADALLAEDLLAATLPRWLFLTSLLELADFPADLTFAAFAFPPFPVPGRLDDTAFATTFLLFLGEDIRMYSLLWRRVGNGTLPASRAGNAVEPPPPASTHFQNGICPAKTFRLKPLFRQALTQGKFPPDGIRGAKKRLRNPAGAASCDIRIWIGVNVC